MHDEGDKIDPYGLPHVRGAEEDVKYPHFTKNVLSRYKQNYFRTVALKPTHDSNLKNSVGWSIVSEAADGSKRVKTTISRISRKVDIV